MTTSLQRNLLGLLLLLVLLAAAGASYKYRLVSKDGEPKFGSDYQLVLLGNGQVLIGKIENLNSEYPLIRDVYSVRVVPAGDPANPQRTTNLLVSRSKEWHAPGFTVLSARNILAIEPVTKGSKMEELIAEDKKNQEHPK